MKRLNLLLSIILIPTMIQAGIVTKQDALLKAKQFMPGKSFQQQEPTRHTSTREGETSSPAYYVFNANNNDGFVIVSADDRTEAILGYADNGFFDDTNMPSNVKAWFEYYEQSIHSLKDENTSTGDRQIISPVKLPVVDLVVGEIYPPQ